MWGESGDNVHFSEICREEMEWNGVAEKVKE